MSYPSYGVQKGRCMKIYAAMVSAALVLNPLSQSPEQFRDRTKSAQAPDGRTCRLCASSFRLVVDRNTALREFAALDRTDRPVLIAQPFSFDSLVTTMEETVKVNGQIGELNLFTHGKSGKIFFQDGSAVDIEKLRALRKEAEANGKDLSSLFAPGAVIRFYGCVLGAGKEGEEFIKYFGDLFLKKGGTIHASRVFVDLPVLDGVVPLGISTPSRGAETLFLTPIRVLAGVKNLVLSPFAYRSFSDWSASVRNPVFTYEVLPPDSV